MADKLDVQVTGKSEAEIAFRLFEIVARVEKVSLFPTDQGGQVADQDYVLKTFAACMIAVKQPSYYLG